LNSMFYYAGILEHTYFIYLKIYFSQISIDACVLIPPTTAGDFQSNQFHYIVGV